MIDDCMCWLTSIPSYGELLQLAVVHRLLAQERHLLICIWKWLDTLRGSEAGTLDNLEGRTHLFRMDRNLDANSYLIISWISSNFWN